MAEISEPELATIRRRLLPRSIALRLNRQSSSSKTLCSVLALDIVGFTRLTESFRGKGPAGIERLARVLTVVFERIDEAVASMGGEVAAISGDGLLALFPDDTGARACFAADTIRKRLARGAEGVLVKARMGLARGTVDLGLYRAGDRAAYSLSGDPVLQAWQAEGAAEDGEIFAHESIAGGTNGLFTRAQGSEFHRLAGPVTAPPGDWASRPTDVPDVGAFVPQHLVERNLGGEFRDVISAFVRIPDEATDQQVRDTVQAILHLRDTWGGIGCRLDHSLAGRCFVLFWGAPSAHERDVARAIHTLLELSRMAPVPLSIGACHGPTFAGFLGASTFQDYTCIGASANFAARIAARAPPGAIWVNEELADRASGLVDVTPADRFTPKGFDSEQTILAVSVRRKQAVARTRSDAVGRKDLEADLTQEIARLAAGDGPWGIVLEGEPGIGKSHLADRARETAPPEITVLMAEADPILRPSLGPCWTLLRQIVDSVEDLHALAERTGNSIVGDALRRAMPLLAAGLGWNRPGTSDPGHDAETMLRLTWDGMVAAFRAAAESTPLLIHLEDIHWLDDDSRAVVSRLLTRANEPIGVLMTARPRPEHLPEEARIDLRRIERLSDESVGELVAAILGGPPSHRLGAVLAARSAGIPLFVAQLVRFLQDRDLITRVGEVWHLSDRFEEDQLPGDARALLVSRIDRLPEAAKAAVAIASVLGGTVGAGLVGAVAQTADQRLVDDPQTALTQAASGGVLVEDAPGEWTFSHALFRDAAYEMQLTSARRDLHRAAASVLEDRGEPAAVLAVHYDRGGLTDQAIRSHTIAGQDASAKYQNEAAAWHLGRALALTDDGEVRARFELALALDAVFARVSDHVRQDKTLEQLDALASQLDLEARFKTVLARMRYFEARGDFASSVALMDANMDHAERFAGTDLAVQFYIQSAHTLLYHQHTNRRNECVPLAQKAVRHARLLGDNERLAQALKQEGLPHRYDNDPAAAKLFRDALDMTRDPVLRANLLQRLGSIAFRQGEIDEGHRLYSEALVLARETGDMDRITSLEWGLGTEAERRGNIAEAEAHHREAYAIAQELNNAMMITEAWKSVTYLIELGGRLAEADTYFDKTILARLEQSAEGRIEQFRLWSHLLRGDLSGYLESLPSAIEWAVELNFGLEELENKVSLCRYSLLLGRRDAFLAHRGRIEQLIEQGDTLEGWGQMRADRNRVRIAAATHACNRAMARMLDGDRDGAWAAANEMARAFVAAGNSAEILDLNTGGSSFGSIGYAVAHHVLRDLGHPAAEAVLRDAMRRLNDLADRYEAAGYPRDSLWRENAFRAYLVEAATTDQPRSLIEVLAAYRNAPASTSA